jgi:hypothetical protein
MPFAAINNREVQRRLTPPDLGIAQANFSGSFSALVLAVL